MMENMLYVNTGKSNNVSSNMPPDNGPDTNPYSRLNREEPFYDEFENYNLTDDEDEPGYGEPYNPKDADNTDTGVTYTGDEQLYAVPGDSGDYEEPNPNPEELNVYDDVITDDDNDYNDTNLGITPGNTAEKKKELNTYGIYGGFNAYVVLRTKKYKRMLKNRKKNNTKYNRLRVNRKYTHKVCRHTNKRRNRRNISKKKKPKRYIITRR